MCDGTPGAWRRSVEPPFGGAGYGPGACAGDPVPDRFAPGRGRSPGIPGGSPRLPGRGFPARHGRPPDEAVPDSPGRIPEKVPWRTAVS